MSKVPVKEPPPDSPTGPLWREMSHYRTFCISLKDLTKIPLIRRPQERSVHPCSPKSGPLRKQKPISEPFFDISLGSQVKNPSLKVPLHVTPEERCPDPRAVLHPS